MATLIGECDKTSRFGPTTRISSTSTLHKSSIGNKHNGCSTYHNSTSCCTTSQGEAWENQMHYHDVWTTAMAAKTTRTLSFFALTCSQSTHSKCSPLRGRNVTFCMTFTRAITQEHVKTQSHALHWNSTSPWESHCKVRNGMSHKTYSTFVIASTYPRMRTFTIGSSNSTTTCASQGMQADGKCWNLYCATTGGPRCCDTLASTARCVTSAYEPRCSGNFPSASSNLAYLESRSLHRPHTTHRQIAKLSMSTRNSSSICASLSVNARTTGRNSYHSRNSSTTTMSTHRRNTPHSYSTLAATHAWASNHMQNCRTSKQSMSSPITCAQP